MSFSDNFDKQVPVTYQGAEQAAKPLHNTSLTTVFRSTLVALSATVASLGVAEVSTAPNREPGHGAVTRTVRDSLKGIFDRKITSAEKGRRMMNECLPYEEPLALTCCNENATFNDVCTFIVNQYINHCYELGMSEFDESEARTLLLVAVSENQNAIKTAWSDYVAAVHAHRNNPANWPDGNTHPVLFEELGTLHKKDMLQAALRQHGIDAALRNSLADTTVAELSQLSTK